MIRVRKDYKLQVPNYVISSAVFIGSFLNYDCLFSSFVMRNYFSRPSKHENQKPNETLYASPILTD
jgi:hypothetical protein